MSGTVQWQPDEAMQRVGRRLAGARKAADMTQQRLADVMGVGRSSVANMEGGRQPVDAVQLALAARALRIPLDALLPAEDLPPAPALPHDVEIRVAYEVTCRTCSPGQPIDVARDKGQAARSRKDHIAEMQERGSGEPS